MSLVLLKALHIGAISIWTACLIGLPFLLHLRNGKREDELFDLHRFTRKLYVAVMSPAAFVAIVSGTVLVLVQQTFEVWFTLKLLLVMILAGIHLFSGSRILKLFEPGRRYPAWRAAAVTTLAAGVSAAIVIVVLAKPELAMSELGGVFAPGALGRLGPFQFLDDTMSPTP